MQMKSKSSMPCTALGWRPYTKHRVLLWKRACSARGLKGRLGAAKRRMLSFALAGAAPIAGDATPAPFVPFGTAEGMTGGSNSVKIEIEKSEIGQCWLWERGVCVGDGGCCSTHKKWLSEGASTIICLDNWYATVAHKVLSSTRVRDNESIGRGFQLGCWQVSSKRISL